MDSLSSGREYHCRDDHLSKQNINKMIRKQKKYAEQFQIEHLLKEKPLAEFHPVVKSESCHMSCVNQ